ncbi:hypothetical protein KEM55_000803 [Ascosphaera atra]|nr:hypothetical protein KEM55_000803 [Ascosphaera atra]
MTGYDSDASSISDDEMENGTQTNVLLGYAEEEEMDDDVSHLGGVPTWMDEGVAPPGTFARCEVCRNNMNLLLQLNGDLPERFPNDSRWLYIYGCARTACNRKPGSVKAFRAVKKHKLSSSSNNKPSAEKTPQASPEQPKKQGPDLGASIFGGPTSAQLAGANPFASAAPSSTPSNPFAPPPSAPSRNGEPKTDDVSKEEDVAKEELPATFADKVRVSSPPPSTPKPVAGPAIPWPAQSAFPEPYKRFYLDADYEVLEAPEAPKMNAKIQTEPTAYEEGGSSSKATDTKGEFESALDKDFLHFSTRLEHNPEQVLRYEYAGTPLLYTTDDPVGKVFSSSSSHNGSSKITTVPAGGSKSSRIPRCPHCGSERVFELQLVPHAIAVLEEDRDIGLPGTKSETGMEWETIIVGVCAANCGPKAVGQLDYREEWVGVQWEEALKLKR